MSIAFPYAHFTQKMPSLVEAGRQEAGRRGHAILVSATVDIPPVEPAVLFGQAHGQERVLWEQPSQALSMAAFGAATRLTGHGHSRFSHISRGWRTLLSRALIDSAPAYPFFTPVGLSGFAFESGYRRDADWEEYPDALLLVPRLLFTSYRESSWLTVNLLTTSDCDAQAAVNDAVVALQALLSEAAGKTNRTTAAPADLEIRQDETQGARWRDAVVKIVNDIERGTIEKLVLARRVTAYSRQMFDPGDIVNRLRVAYGHCTLFAFASAKSCFVGATPERLIRLAGRTIHTDCLAGSTRRGATPDEDHALGEALLADRKERREHAVVVHALRELLTPSCACLTVLDTPRLLRMPNVQHLHTPLEGVLKEETDIFALVERLHPTPATGGLPRETARTLLHTYEAFARGWYAGPVGWIDGHGGGEFVVAIRSALLRDHTARLYAGCGIVAGSDPEREYAESCLKLRPMLWALNGR